MPLEDINELLKWFNSSRIGFKIFYDKDRPCKSDFFIEAETHKLLCDAKMEKEVNSKQVQKKVISEDKWCKRASEHQLHLGGKPWKYLRIPHNIIQQNATFAMLILRFRREAV